MKSLTRRILTAVAVVILLAGATMFLYPYYFGWQSAKTVADQITQYDEGIKALREDTSAPLDRLYTDIYKYNSEICSNRQAELKNPEAYERSLFDLTEYGLNSDLFGYVSIPSLELKLPIYMGATKNNMAKGAAHMTYSSLPINQNDTNSVLVAHRGYRGAPYFRHIDKLKVGDTITVTNPWGTLTYTVFETKIIAKNDVEAVKIRSDKKMLTLSSCHPVTKNTHRYLVFAQLTDAKQDITSAAQTPKG